MAHVVRAPREELAGGVANGHAELGVQVQVGPGFQAGAYAVDLRIRLDYYDTEASSWQPLVWHNLREWHARTLHVMLVAADLSAVYHWHAALDADYPANDVFTVVGATLARAGEYHALLSFLVEGEEIDMCVLEGAAHVHWSGGDLLDDGEWNSIGIEVASLEPASAKTSHE